MTQIRVSKEVVKKSCENAIASIKSRRQALFDKEVDKVMKRWFFPIRDRVKAEAYVKNDPSDFADWLFNGWGTEGRALTLLKAMSVSMDESLILDSNDASFVAEWAEEAKEATC